MAKTFIGIDVDDNLLRLVALEESGKELKTVALVQREISTEADSAETVVEALQEWDNSNCRMAMTVPATNVLARRLQFPFGDRKKIAAAVPLELGARLPIDLGDHYIASLPPVATEGKYSTIGLALQKNLIEKSLEPFDTRKLPLRHLGIAPFTYVGRFSHQPDDCLLLAVSSTEFSTLLVLSGKPVSYRTATRNCRHSIDEIITELNRDIHTLQKAEGQSNLPVLIFGAGLNNELLETLRNSLPNASLPEEQFEGEQIPAEFLSAFALARLAAEPGQTCNLRQGPYAFRGSLAPFKKQLIVAATLLCLAFFTLIAGAWLSYSGKAAIVKNIEQQMAEIYSQTVPGSDRTPKDIPLHMTSRLNAARNQSQLFGGTSAAPLTILETITRALPDNSASLIRDLGYDESGIRISGQAKSFDAVDQLAAGLKKETIFSSVRISDAKTNIDGKQVNFRIDVAFAGKGGQ